MKPKIFISSTYLDLIPYRKKLWEVLSNLDIHILGMENFGARSSAPLETCLQEVTQGDVFIGILAYRYGSIDSASKKSFTQLEYERAIDCKKEILIYKFDEDSFIKPRFIDFGTKSNKLIKFKRILSNNHTVETYKDPGDLSFKVDKDLRDLLPRLPKKFIRPKKLDAKIHRFTINNKKWIAFVGYLDNIPLEIYTGPSQDEMFPIPISITSGKISEEIDLNGLNRYDFSYMDKFGYINSMGGLNHVFDEQMTRYSRIITQLLRDFTPLHTVVKVIDEMNINSINEPEDWKRGVKEALIK